MRTRTITAAEANAMLAAIKAAPVLDIPPGEERSFGVARVGVLPPVPGAPTFGYFQTVNGAWSRLPPSLGAWAYDLVALALATQNPFPCPVRFGRHDNGTYWAELD